MEKFFYNGIVLNSSSIDNLSSKREFSIYWGIDDIGNLYVLKFVKNYPSSDGNTLQIRCYLSDGELLKKVGFIYFTINFSEKSSNYIGTKVYSDYRNMGIATLLTSAWIQICFDNGIEDLYTNTKQRKPMLIYLLQKFSFESLVLPSKRDAHRVYLFKKDGDLKEYVLFQNEQQGNRFKKTKLFRESSYDFLNLSDLDDVSYYDDNDDVIILGCGEDKRLLVLKNKDTKYLGNVIYNTPYFLKDGCYAYDMALNNLSSGVKKRIK